MIAAAGAALCLPGAAIAATPPATGSWCETPAPGGRLVEGEGMAATRAAGRARTIVILIHGFDTAGTPANVSDMWLSMRTATRAADRTAAICIARWDSRRGIDDANGGLSHLLDAVARGATGSRPDGQRVITFVGHSAGGNRAKAELLRLHDRAAWPAGTRIRLLTLGTPHRGVPMADQEVAVGRLADMFGARGALERAGLGSAGLREMRVDAPALRTLNARFVRAVAPSDRWAIASVQDQVVPTWSACPAWMRCQRLDRLDHVGLLDPFAQPGFRIRFAAFIRGGTLS